MANELLPSLVAIVGRPNVGKSRLFNRYAGARRALVSDRAGMTRDRIAEEIEVEGRKVLLVDTAGLDDEMGDDLAEAIQAQAQVAEASLPYGDTPPTSAKSSSPSTPTWRATRRPITSGNCSSRSACASRASHAACLSAATSNTPTKRRCRGRSKAAPLFDCGSQIAECGLGAR